MLLHGLHNVKEASQYDFSLKYKSRGGQVLRNGQKPNQHDDREQHENLSTHVNRNITMPSFHRGWVPDTDVVPSSENRNTFVSFVSSK